MTELESLIVGVLNSVGIDTSTMHFKLKLYSKRNLGVYHPNTKNVFVYLTNKLDAQGNPIEIKPLKELVLVAIHESCHHLQWEDLSFERIHGVMHNDEFWEMYEDYKNKFLSMYNRAQLKEKLIDEEKIIRYLAKDDTVRK